MANLTELQTRITAIFDQAGGSIDSSSSEYTRRKTLLNKSLRKWALEKGYTWRQLIETTTLNTVADQNYVDLPSDYKYGNLLIPQSQRLTVGAEQYPVVEIGDALNRNTADFYIYISGNPGTGYRLNINPTPTVVASIPLNYYTSNLATDSLGVSRAELTDGTDISKCPSDDFLVYDTVADMFLIDDEGDQYSQYRDMAQMEMDRMLINNELGESNQGVSMVFVDNAQGIEAIGGYLDY
jgi:hypothetical protein